MNYHSESQKEESFQVIISRATSESESVYVAIGLLGLIRSFRGELVQRRFIGEKRGDGIVYKNKRSI